MDELIVCILSLIVGSGATWFVVRLLGLGGRHRSEAAPILTESIVERVQSVGRLTGLEVSSKEITTQVKGGVKWLPRLVVSPARLAVIFHFETHFFVDLGRLGHDDVRLVGDRRYEIRLPRIESSFLLRELEAYDIQAGRVLGLFDVSTLDAATHNELMQRARSEAEELFRRDRGRYEDQARQAVAHQLAALLQMVGVTATVTFRDRDDAGRSSVSVPAFENQQREALAAAEPA